MFPRIKRPGRDADREIVSLFPHVPSCCTEEQLIFRNHFALVARNKQINFELHLHEVGVVFVLFEQK